MALEIERKYFADPQNGGLDSDSAPFAVSPNNIINSENIRWGTTDAGVTNVIESIGSAVLKSTPQPSITFLTIGAADDSSNKRFCKFQFCTTGPWHRIICHYVETGIELNVLFSSQVEGGLNFDKDSLITARIINGLLYWTENLNEPRKINIDRGLKLNNPSMFVDIEIVEVLFTGSILFLSVNTITLTPAQGATHSFSIGEIINISGTATNDGRYTITNVIVSGTTTLFIFPHVTITGTQSGTFSLCGDVGIVAYTAPIDYTVITLIKRPPIFPLTTNKIEDLTYENNFIKNEAIQATYYYVYRDNEESALSSYGALAPYSFATETTNAIDLALPFDEFIEQDVELICICVKYGNDGKTARVKTFDRSNPVDAAAITAHNNNTTQLAYRYFNDVTGIQLDDVKANAPFHGVPLLSETPEIAKNRLFLGNNLFGYDTPLSTSLAITLGSTDTGGGGTFPAEWKYFDLTAGPGGDTSVFRYYYAYLATIAPSVYYYLAYQTASPPISINSDSADVRQYSESAMAQWILANTSPPDGKVWSTFPYNSESAGTLYFRNAGYPYSNLYTDLVYIVQIQLQQFFKSCSTYNVSISFYDRFRRKCGVVDVENKLTIPERTFDQVSFVTTINWILNNANALEEIPDWAYYYQIHITKNLTTRFFVQGMSFGAAYVKKDPATGDFDFTGTTYNKETTYALGINISPLTSYGLGYVFSEGDLCRLYTDPSNNYLLSVIGQSGSYVLLAPQSIGIVDPAGYKALFELYTPYKQSVREPFYETGYVMQINQPGTDARQYNTLSGTISGDCYALERSLEDTTIYIVEAMSPNDNVWKLWQTDRGWFNIVDKIGQTRQKSNITWSDVLVPETRTNGLNVFQPLNRKTMFQECGQLQKLQLTSKVEDELGSVMLGICELETVSMYLGETQVVSPTGDAFLATSPDVIGTTNVLKGSFGTINPESVTEYRGNVYWFDAHNGRIIQYSVNGLFAISNYKMTRFWKLFSNQYLSMTTAEIEALGGRPFIFSTVDPHHNELLFSIPKLINVPPKGYLPDYPSAIYPFDIWDGQGKTVVYKLDVGAGSTPHWQGAYSFNPEWFIGIMDNLYSFKYGSTYLHNSESSFNNFYGIQYTSRIMFVSNGHPNMPKVYNSLSVESNLIPLFVYFYNNYPIQQSSDLEEIDFKELEGVWYASIYRNKLIPTQTGYTTDGLLTGEKMRNIAMMIMLEFESDVKQLNLMFANIGFTISRGHRV